MITPSEEFFKKVPGNFHHLLFVLGGGGGGRITPLKRFGGTLRSKALLRNLPLGSFLGIIPSKAFYQEKILEKIVMPLFVVTVLVVVVVAAVREPLRRFSQEPFPRNRLRNISPGKSCHVRCDGRCLAVMVREVKRVLSRFLSGEVSALEKEGGREQGARR